MDLGGACLPAGTVFKKATLQVFKHRSKVGFTVQHAADSAKPQGWTVACLPSSQTRGQHFRASLGGEAQRGSRAELGLCLRGVGPFLNPSGSWS